MAVNYYGFSFSLGGTASTSAYYYISVTSGSVYAGAAVTIYPGNTSPAYFAYRENSVQWQAAPGRITAGMTVGTEGTSIQGVLGISPAINVDATLVCYGGNGQIGSVTLPAGKSEVPFNFNVSSAESLGENSDFLDKNVPKPE
jgi:hypothetical protein